MMRKRCMLILLVVAIATACSKESSPTAPTNTTNSGHSLTFKMRDGSCQPNYSSFTIGMRCESGCEMDGELLQGQNISTASGSTAVFRNVTRGTWVYTVIPTTGQYAVLLQDRVTMDTDRTISLYCGK